MQCGILWLLQCWSVALQVQVGVDPPGARVALPAVLRRPRAAPTHLRAAAIRLNVVIWTNMDPSEGGRKSCHECSGDSFSFHQAHSFMSVSTKVAQFD